MMLAVAGAGLVLAAGTILYLEKTFRFFTLIRYRVKPNSEENGGELVARVLKAHNVSHIFCLCGGHISPILIGCDKIGIRVVDTRHEASAVFAADAMARLSGTVGVAVVTAGPGVTNTITAMKNAQLAESPVLLIGGAAATILKGRGALQDIDQMSLFKPLCKFCGTVTSVREIIPVMKKAIQIAQSGTPGPVFLEFPVDCLYPYSAVMKELSMKPGKSLSQKFVSYYLECYLKNIFAGAFDSKDYSPLTVHLPFASTSQVQLASEIVRGAQKPVVVVGSQATLPPVPVADLRKALEALGIPVFLGGMSRGLLGQNSPIQMRQKRREALQDADVVILAGCVPDFRLGYGRTLSKKSKIIAVNREKQHLEKNTDLFWKPTLAVVSDVASFILQLGNQLKGYKCPETWIQKLRDNDNDKEKENVKKCEEKLAEHMNPVKLLHSIENILPDNAIIVADGGDFVGTAAYILKPRGPLQWLDPGAFGTLGVGGGFALGAKLSRPESEVWLIYGDGSCGYSIAEFDTFTRHKTPVIAVVGNDAAWMQIARDQVPRYGNSVGCMLSYSDYHTVAEGFGGKGLRVTTEQEDTLEEILNRARDLHKQGNSVLLNAIIGRTDFREGSISL